MHISKKIHFPEEVVKENKVNHSFILDIEDELIVEHFTEKEIEEIDSTPILVVPELSKEVAWKGNKKYFICILLVCMYTIICHHLSAHIQHIWISSEFL